MTNWWETGSQVKKGNVTGVQTNPHLYSLYLLPHYEEAIWKLSLQVDLVIISC